MATKNELTGMAGEHWVCSILAQHGWNVALTRDGSERSDLFAAKQLDGRRHVIEVQVKTAQDAGRGLHTNLRLGKKAQDVAVGSHEWFALVLLALKGSTNAPQTFMVPRTHVSAAQTLDFKIWKYSNRSPKEAANLKTTMASTFTNLSWFKYYKDCFELLEQSTAEAPNLLHPELSDRMNEIPQVRFGDEHPWSTNPPTWDAPLEED